MEAAGPDPTFAPHSTVVDVHMVSHFFGEGDARNQVLFDNCLAIGSGELVVITGPSGSGKTTLLTLIGALRSVQSGSIRVLAQDLSALAGRDLVAMRRNIGFIFQMHNLFEALSAYENVRLAIELGDCPRREIRRRGMDMLERLGLGHRSDYKPRALSGGQRQRVAVARALVNRPKLVLADEPTAALDKESSRIVAGLLKELTVEEGCTVLMVTHDNRLLEVADRIVNVVDGVIKSNVVLREAVIVCQFLRGLKLFETLTPAELTRVAERMKPRRFANGDVIIREGDPGHEFFLVGRGNVDVMRRSGLDAGEQRVAALGPGNCFGERALITDEPRNATVVARDEVETYALGKDDFHKALAASPSFREQLHEIYFQRQ